MASADALAQHLSRFPAAGVGMAKAMVLRSGELDRETSLRLEGWVQSILLRQSDVGSAFADALGYIKQQLGAPEDL